MRIYFMGGADTVTGSQHIVQAGESRVLRDCGTFQGRRDEAREINSHLPFDPKGLHSVLISHAHIDHCGNIPTLVNGGYRGPLHMTTATVDLCDIMLKDSARIQEQDAMYLNQKANRKGLPLVAPLYTVKDAERAISQFVGHRYHELLDMAPGITVEDFDAGHILGSALSVFTLEEQGRKVRVGFAVDLGRHDLPLIRDPERMENIDILVMESTYGDRLHSDAIQADDQLRQVILETIQQRGRIFIPSFALERAQEIIYHVSSLIMTKQIPRVQVYVDSPMASSVARVFEEQSQYLDEAAKKRLAEVGCLLCPDWIRFVSSVEESKAITGSDEPCIIIAASGMCEHGRILHHLKSGIGNPKNTIVLVGFQAEYTLGRRLQEQQPEVKIFGDMFKRKARVVDLDAFSAHADRNDLIGYVRATKPKKTFLVHGESHQREALAEALRDQKLTEVFLPKRGDYADI